MSNPHDRRVTWLELFFDLTFVAAITAIAGQLAKQYAWYGVAAYVALFVPIWWAWVGYTVYANRFERDDPTHRALTCLMMFAAAGMAVQLGKIGETGGAGFALAYVLARAVLLAQYARERGRPEARPLVDRYLAGFGLGALVWLGSLLAPPPLRYGLWAVGLGIELATPWIARPVLARMPLHVAHLPERMGLFTLILLGESMVVTVTGTASEAWGPGLLAMATLAFAIAVAIWWNYFAFVEETPFACRLGSGQPYIYAHLAMALGLTALAAGTKRALHEVAEAAFSAPTLLLLALGAAAWFLAFLALQASSYDAFPRARAAIYLAAGVGVPLALALGGGLPPLAAFGIVAAAFGLVAGLVARAYPGHPAAEVALGSAVAEEPAPEAAGTEA